MTTRWLFGDQLGPHFTDDHRGPLLMVESKAVFRRRRFHRAKAHLVLSRDAAPRGRLRRPADLRPRRHVRRGRRAARRRRGRAPHVVRRAGPGRAARAPTVLEPRGFATAACGLRALGRRPRGQSGCSWRTSTGGPGWRTASSSTAASRPAVGGTSTTTTASHRRRARPPSASPSRGGRPRTTSTPRCARTSTGGSATATWRSSAATAVRRFAATRREALAALDHFVEHRLPELRCARGRGARGRPVDGALAGQRPDEPRAARPARGRTSAPRRRTSRGGADRLASRASCAR